MIRQHRPSSPEQDGTGSFARKEFVVGYFLLFPSFAAERHGRIRGKEREPQEEINGS